MNLINHSFTKYSLIDVCIRDCQNEYFHTYKYKCVYDVKLSNISYNELVNLAVSGKEINVYGLSKNWKWLNKMVFFSLNKWIN